MAVTLTAFFAAAFTHNEQIPNRPFGRTVAVAFHVHQKPQEAPCVAATVSAVHPACMAVVAAERQEVADASQERLERAAGGGDWYALIVDACNSYGCDPAVLYRIMMCESTGDPYADNGVCKGLFQFNPSTWLTTPEGAAGASIWDGAAQVRMTAWMFAQGRQNEWTCY